MSTVSASRTARARVREEMTGEILAVARRHLARDGAAALSLRSIARDLGMAPSALYRYFDGRDALLGGLILSSYDSLAAVAERAAERAEATPGTDAERFLEVPRALRLWALERPHEWGLVFGTPVPGYEAPYDTVVPYVRVAAALVRPLVEATSAGRLQVPKGAQVSRELEDALGPVSEGLLPGMPVDLVLRAVQAWTVLIGAISLEVFGHWRNTILEPLCYFERTTLDTASALGLSGRPRTSSSPPQERPTITAGDREKG